MESLRGASTLHEEWEKTKENLRGVEDNIKKLYGRDSIDNRPVQRRFSRGDGDGGRGGAAGRLFGEARKTLGGNPNREPLRGGVDRMRPTRTVSLEGGSRLGAVQSRLGPKRRRDSDDEMDSSLPRPSVQSSVILQPKDVPKREESAAMQTDRKGLARNRRMFGALLGTLQKFQSDSKKEVDKEKKRATVEKKLEQKAKDEKDQLRQERAALWNERAAKQKELRQLEYKMRIVKMFEAWERQIRKQANFIKTTKGKPYIFYKPKTLLPANEKAMEMTKDFIEDLVRERKTKLEAEINKLMSDAPKRRRSPERRDRHGDGDQDKSESESESERSDSDRASSDSELEEGEVPSRKRPRRQSDAPMLTEGDIKKEKEVKVKVEKDDSMDAAGEAAAHSDEDQNSRQVGKGDNGLGMDRDEGREDGVWEGRDKRSRSPQPDEEAKRKTDEESPDRSSSHSKSRSPSP